MKFIIFQFIFVTYKLFSILHANMIKIVKISRIFKITVFSIFQLKKVVSSLFNACAKNFLQIRDEWIKSINSGRRPRTCIAILLGNPESITLFVNLNNHSHLY